RRGSRFRGNGPTERPGTASPRMLVAQPRSELRRALDTCKLESYRQSRMRRPQLELTLPAPAAWGGRRAGAGRKPTPGRRPGVAHRTRPHHEAPHPVHITLRANPAIRCLRADRVFPIVRLSLAAASHPGFRILQFSVQDDHFHLLVEADDRR